LRWAVADTVTVAGARLAHLRYAPEKLAAIVVQPVIFVLLFGYVFGSAISVPGGGNYREYLMPGIFAMGSVGTLVATAVGVADDLAKGVTDRFRSLPMARSAVLMGRNLGDQVEGLLAIGALIACGFAVGWRAHRGPWLALAAFGLLMLFSSAMKCVGLWIGTYARGPESADSLGMLVFFPLTFIGNTFVPTANMPLVLRVVAEWNPISAMAAACRQLFGSPGAAPAGAWPLHHPVLAVLAWTALVGAVFAPLAVRRYRRATR
jgi:ABC-2 type transport system permease protein